jgi:hypothetical protein
MRFIEGYHYQYNAAKFYLQHEEWVPYKDLVPLNYLVGYVTDEGVQGVWRPIHSSFNEGRFYEYTNNKIVSEFEYFPGTENVGYEIIYDKDNENRATEFYYYKNDQIKIKTRYNRAHKDGLEVEYYSNGDIKSERKYDMDLLVSQEDYENKWDLEDEEED